ncbi:uncharacterized protein LOC118433540 [Folsomia candida]|uniref:Uncharacterized protein n=1 Tax=Folsomia candida TaxID=158441 RepID=A0A226CVL0_FOLCA|nr:uncharacterized protein LOC118433540 [Folsomia candida]OXA37435.1 hypothetical protein Fcan01_27798 [Folsomia candida]
MRYLTNKYLRIYFNFENNISQFFALMAIPFYTHGDEEEDESELVEKTSGESEFSFLRRFLLDLVKSYCRYKMCNSGGSTTRKESERRTSGRSRSRNRGKSLPQNSTSQSTRQSPPDLVCCHVQAINGERELNNQPSQQRDQETTDELNNNTNSQLVPRRRRQESQLPSTPDIETDTSDRSMIEIQVNAEYTYRMIGEGLRKIADQFEIDRSKNSPHRRTRHPAGNHRPTIIPTLQIDIKFRFALKITIPLTLVGLSLAFIKRNCT